MHIPFIREKDESERKASTREILHILPETMNIETTIEPEIRYRGIYKTVLYKASISLQGNFDIDASPFSPQCNYLTDESYISIGVSDQRGFTDRLTLKVNDLNIIGKPGLSAQDLSNNGVRFPYNLSTTPDTLTFSCDFQLNGSENLSFVPIGKTSNINIKSQWSNPSFTGEFLPVSRNIDKNGFKAQWQQTELNLPFPSYWNNKEFSLKEQKIGVELLMPSEHYAKATRSAKYGVLLILTKFDVLIFVEISRKKHMHIFHYLLVGLALVLFFSLLTALSEHTGFAIAYLTASVATIGLIAFFTKGVINDSLSVLTLTGVLTGFYIFIYILLSLNDFAFLVGNIGLFIILAATMGFSRKIRNDRQIE